MRYDPETGPDPAEWNSAGEDEKSLAVEHYHRRRRIRLPNARVHAVVHAVVENQIAMGDAYVAKSVLERLLSEGLTRHETIHAMGTVVSEIMFGALKGTMASDLNLECRERLLKLTAKSWHDEYGRP